MARKIGGTKLITGYIIVNDLRPNTLVLIRGNGKSGAQWQPADELYRGFVFQIGSLRKAFDRDEIWARKESVVYAASLNPATGRKTVDESSPIRLSVFKRMLFSGDVTV